MRDSFEPFGALSDGVVTLRRLALGDAAAVTEACQDPEMVRWTASIVHPYREENAIKWLEGQPAKWNDAYIAGLAITDAPSGEFWGNISLVGVNWRTRHADVGYWMGAPWRGQGATTRALVLLVQWAFEVLDLHELSLETVIGNVASERVATKAGFEFVGEAYDVHVPIRPDRTFDVRKWRRARSNEGVE
ncbi:MAG TPA: GNAT family N-acetyltransferase [Acidimicrobiales bacterium]|nr:MAG: hypothetical protein B7X07_00375 [Actinobacteria bacterium 21-64-8]HQT99049.1 GNAT family N-acetyltransferase [Acidimicrobiales bacterium]